MWIGLNDIDTEGTVTWKNGEDYLFTAWSEGGGPLDDGRDCVVMNTAFQYINKTCGAQDIKGHLCMKGAISKIGTQYRDGQYDLHLNLYGPKCGIQVRVIPNSNCYPGVPTYVYEKKVGGSGGNGRKYVSSITKETLFDLVNEAFDGDQVIN